MKTQLMELTAVTFTGLITATAGQALWDLSAGVAAVAAASGPDDWPRGTALLAAMAGRRLLSKEAAAAAATCCTKHWRKALYIFAYFDLHRRGEVDGVLAGAVINAMGTAHAWPEATSLLGSLPGPASQHVSLSAVSLPSPPSLRLVLFPPLRHGPYAEASFEASRRLQRADHRLWPGHGGHCDTPLGALERTD